MNVPTWVWLATVAALVILIAIDLLLVGRAAHEVSMREAAVSVEIYLVLAVGFGVGVLGVSGTRYGGEFFAGWLTSTACPSTTCSSS